MHHNKQDVIGVTGIRAYKAIMGPSKASAFQRKWIGRTFGPSPITLEKMDRENFLSHHTRIRVLELP